MRRSWSKVVWLLVAGAIGGAVAGRASEPPAALLVGVDANYARGMEAAGRTWRWTEQPEELYAGMAKRGVRALRVRLWTGDEGPNGKADATEVVRRALRAGLDPYLVIFLSEDWADLMKQPAPTPWKGLDVEARAAAVRTYSREIVAHFRREGLTSHLYEIGNEIDYGICGIYPGKSTKKTPASLRRAIWPQAARLIRASEEGVRAADPKAKFLLHIAHWWDAEFCTAFFQFMLRQGVQVDYAGLSYFPSANLGGSLELEQFGAVTAAVSAAIGRPIIVPETAYPATSEFTGQFSRWKKAAPGYPLSPDGQRRWLADLLGFAARRPEIAGVFYWSPEWCGEGMWKAFALFDVEGRARPAWAAFAAPDRGAGVERRTVYLEVADDRITVVPVAAARMRAKETLATLLRAHGRVDQAYIAAITAADLRVAGYRVNLRASLSGNLDLMRAGGGEAIPAAADAADWRAIVRGLDPRRERLVVFVRAGASAEPVENLARQHGIEVALHPLVGEAPLKFGLGAGAAEATSEPDEE